MLKKYLLLFIFLLTLSSLIFPKNSLAVSINVVNFPSEIHEEENFNVNVLISGAANATNYLRVDLFKEGTTNYFGETFNGVLWYGGSTGTSYFPVQIIDSTASATVQGRVGTPSQTDYPGPGNYKLKIRRYTNSGSVASGDTQAFVDVQITKNTPTPTTSPSPEPSSTPTNSPPPLPSPSLTPIPIETTSPKPTPYSSRLLEVKKELFRFLIWYFKVSLHSH